MLDEEGAGQEGVSLLKQQAAERLAAHRARRPRAVEPLLFEEASPTPRLETRAERIAAAVAERYAHSPSYRAFLEAEARRSLEEARARAEVARLAAEAMEAAERVAVAQQQLLSDLESWTAVEPDFVAVPSLAPAIVPPPALTVRLYEERSPTELASIRANAVPHEPLEEEERLVLDEEIAFRQAPVFEDLQEIAVPLPANLIEFPRQLVAARRARPRFAEGPLREEAEENARGQLRIFEVEPELISTVAETRTEDTLPEWEFHPPERLCAERGATRGGVPGQLRSPAACGALSLRVMAALVDGFLLLGTLLGVVATVARLAGEIPSGQIAAAALAIALAGLSLVYFLFFFTFAEATPGMRYARIGLCTLDDDNPSRAAMRRRLLAILLAVAPLGLGFAWALFDEEGLGWHDRMSRMYQRSY